MSMLEETEYFCEIRITLDFYNSPQVKQRLIYPSQVDDQPL